jgi:hypothetical protein
MPKEKFYGGTPENTEEWFTVTWGTDANDWHKAPVMVAGISTDRSSLNRLIKTLRRARDATYGADE